VWPDKCALGTQSPIDVCNGQNNAAVTDTTIVPSTHYSSAQTFKFKSDGQAYIDASGLGMSLTAGKLASLNRPALTEPDAGFTWNLAQAHFHWGRDKTEGSEHYIEGHQYPLEVHFVHLNSKYATLTEGLESGNADALLVVGQMFKVGDTESSALAALANTFAHPKALDGTGAEVSMIATDMMDTSAGFYTYPGSLTTPTCNAVVTWVVLASEKTVTEATLNKFIATQNKERLTHEFGNYRPLMPLDGRTVYKSPAVTSLPCRDTREAVFSCAAASTDATTESDEATDDKKDDEILTLAKVAVGLAATAAAASLAILVKMLSAPKSDYSPNVKATVTTEPVSLMPAPAKELAASNMLPVFAPSLASPGIHALSGGPTPTIVNFKR